MAEVTAPLLRIQGLSKDFITNAMGCFRAVDNVDLDIYDGETWGVVGESGSGKTTLARCAMRLIEPSGGRVIFQGQNLADLSPKALRAQRREFQMIFQDSLASLNPAMTVEKIISEPLEIHGIGSRKSRRRQVGELLEMVSLSESLLGRYPSDLSGGQRQRAGIARALALKPRLLIADEPVSALDASVQMQILNLLGDLRKRCGLTLILITHSLCAASYLCTHISVMRKGEMVEKSEAEKFFTKMKDL